jgi:hypothetical protein
VAPSERSSSKSEKDTAVSHGETAVSSIDQRPGNVTIGDLQAAGFVFLPGTEDDSIVSGTAVTINSPVASMCFNQ